MVPAMDLDDVDRAIIAALLSDARASQRHLSREVGAVSYTHLTLPTTPRV